MLYLQISNNLIKAFHTVLDLLFMNQPQTQDKRFPTKLCTNMAAHTLKLNQPVFIHGLLPCSIGHRASKLWSGG